MKPALPNAQRYDERKLFATKSNPVCIVEECDSTVGPDNVIPKWVPATDE